MRALIGPIKSVFISECSSESSPAVCKSYWKLPDVEAAVSHCCPSVGLCSPQGAFYWQRLQELTAHSSICHIRVGVKIAFGPRVRKTCTRSGGSKRFSVCSRFWNMKDMQCKVILRSAFSIGSVCFLSVFGASHIYCCNVTALYKDHLSIKACGRYCCLCPWFFCWWTSEFLYRLLCLSVQPWWLLPLVLTIQFFFYLF